MSKGMTAQEVANEKADRIMKGVGKWAGYYRANPQRFVKDYLHINLKLFQKILLYAMMHNNFFMYIAARGQGKTFLVSLFLMLRVQAEGTNFIASSYSVFFRPEMKMIESCTSLIFIVNSSL